MKAGTLTAGLTLAALMACGPPEADAPTTEATADAGQTQAPDATLQWVPAEGLPPGAEMAVVSGNPAEAGEFTARLRFPDDYRVPPHTHPAAETFTVVSGLLHYGTGTNYNLADATEMRPGQSLNVPAGQVHWAHAVGPTVIEVRASGPFGISYPNPEDDPNR